MSCSLCHLGVEVLFELTPQREALILRSHLVVPHQYLKKALRFILCKDTEFIFCVLIKKSKGVYFYINKHKILLISDERYTKICNKFVIRDPASFTQMR